MTNMPNENTQTPAVKFPVYSSFFKDTMYFPAFQQETGQYILTHSGLKEYMLDFMKRMAQEGTPVTVDYTPIETSLSHCIVSCTVALGGYRITETGESNMATLNTAVAKSYPYLQAQLRAYDRAVISFLQLNIDGKRVYSNEEIL